MDPDSAIGYMILAAKLLGGSEIAISILASEMLNTMQVFSENEASQAYGEFTKY